MFKLKPLDQAREHPSWRPGQLVETPRGTIHARVSGEGPDVVFLHGITDSSLTWRLVQERLSGVRMHALDLPGHGLSDIPETARTPRELAESVRAYLDTAGVKRAVIVGWSLGGAVAVELAALDPERVQALVLLGPAAVPMKVSGGLALLKLPFVCESMSLMRRDSFSRRMASRDMYGPSFEPNEEVLDDYYQGWRVRGRGAFIRSLLGTLDFEDTAKRAKQITTPAWVVHGEADRLVPVNVGKELAEILPNAELVLLPGVGHSPHIEQPDKVVATIRDALATG